MLGKLRRFATSVKRELGVYQRVLRHPRTPRLAKALLGAAVGYLLLPFDLIPDWIPIVGYLDDAIIVPVLVIVALKFVPPEVMAECRRDADQA